MQFSSRVDLIGAVVYVTCYPCIDCARKLIQKRPRMIVYNVAVPKYVEESRPLFETLAKNQKIRIDIVSLNSLCQPQRVATKDKEKDTEPQQVASSKVFLRLTGIDKRLLRENWEYLWMCLAKLASQRSVSDDAAGAVIVKEKRVLAYGFTGRPQALRHLEDEPALKDKTTTLDITAISNALVYLTREQTCGSTVYCTRKPTSSEMKEMIQREVQVVKYLEQETNNLRKLQTEQRHLATVIKYEQDPDTNKKQRWDESPLKQEIEDAKEFRLVEQLAATNPIALRPFLLHYKPKQQKGAEKPQGKTKAMFDDLQVEIAPFEVTEWEKEYPKKHYKNLALVIPDCSETEKNAVEDMEVWTKSPLGLSETHHQGRHRTSEGLQQKPLDLGDETEP